MKPDLKAIKERCDAATPGPWTACLGSGMHECTAIASNAVGAGLFVCDLIPDWLFDQPEAAESLKYKPANMEFLENIRTDIPSLLAYIERLEKALTKIKAESQDNRIAAIADDALNDISIVF